MVNIYNTYIRLSSHEIAQYNDIEVIFIAVLIKFGLCYVYYVFCGMYLRNNIMIYDLPVDRYRDLDRRHDRAIYAAVYATRARLIKTRTRWRNDSKTGGVMICVRSIKSDL